MRKTTVTFSLRVPVVATEADSSPQLKDLLKAWRVIKGVIDVEIEWKSRRTAALTRPTTAYLVARVRIEGDSGKQLQRLYNKLTREASKEEGRLASRECILNEMFE